jgi:hypothetical protein
MSKTYIQMRRYRAAQYYKNRTSRLYDYIGPFRIFMGHSKRDLMEPADWSLHRYPCHWHNNHKNQAKYWFTWSKRRFRRETRKLLNTGRYDEIPQKPENVDWHIC